MYYSTVYVGMDVHKENFSLCCYTNEKEKAEYAQKVEGHYSKVLNYLEAMRFHYGKDVLFICGYEAGCLGFTLVWNGILKVQSTNTQKSDKIKTNLERKKKNEVQQGIQGGSLKAIR